MEIGTNFPPSYNVSFSGVSKVFTTFRPFAGELPLNAVRFAVFTAVANCPRCLGSDCSLQWLNPLTPKDLYTSRTAPLTSKRCILYIYSTNVGTEHFKHALYSPFFSLQNAFCFIMQLVWFLYYSHFIYRVYWNLKKNNSGAKGFVSFLSRKTFCCFSSEGSSSGTDYRGRGPKGNRTQRGSKVLFVLSLGLPSKKVSSFCNHLSSIRRHVKEWRYSSTHSYPIQ